MVESHKNLLLITGATGYIGSHVLTEALKAGYQVRATARPNKISVLKERYGDSVDVVGIADLSSGNYTEALKDVFAVIHIAAQVSQAGDSSAAATLDINCGGVLNIVQQAKAQGVKRIVLTGTFMTSLDVEKLYDNIYNDLPRLINETHWNPATEEGLLNGEHHFPWIYSACKTIAEQKTWKFAEAHPEVDITIINPPFIYGPIPEGIKLLKGDVSGLSNLSLFHKFVMPSGGAANPLINPQFIPPLTMDVRDLARAHILALKAPSQHEVGQKKRLLIAGPSFTWKMAIDHLRATRPELYDAGRLPDVTGLHDIEHVGIDSSFAEQVLGIDDYIDWKRTVEDSADALLAIEKDWGCPLDPYFPTL